DSFVLVSKFTFLADFVIVDYESDPRVPLILGRPFLQTTRALIDIHREEMILCDGDEKLTLNMRHDTSSYSNQPQKESINLINVFNDLSEDFLENLFSTNQQSGNPIFSSHLKLTLPKVKDDIFDLEGVNVLPEKLLDLDSTKDLHPPHHINPLSGSTTSFSFSNHLFEEFADELTLITFPPRNDDLSCEIESNLKEIEYLLHHDPIKDIDSILMDSIDQSNLVDLKDNLVDSMPEMFTDEHALDYSSPSLYDEYDDDLFEEFADELALITYPLDYDDNLTCDIESDIREIELLLYQGEDSDFKDSIGQSVLTHCDDLFVDPTPEMFIDEQPLDYSFPPRFDVYPDDFLEIESDYDTFDDDLFDSEGEKIKESELLIDQLDLPC
nr:reverse transcriptase domain-containing protein [Tanacetum cinerariifolium]